MTTAVLRALVEAPGADTAAAKLGLGAEQG